MKTLFLMTFLTAQFLGLHLPTDITTTNPKKATLCFEATTIDYGIIKKGSDPVRIFKFSNTGQAPLLIIDAKGSCGCTVPTFPSEALPSGTSGEISVRYDTNRVGVFQKNITITSNAGEPVILKIIGEVKETM